MAKVLSEQNDHLWVITLNHTEKHNAFDDELLSLLDQSLEQAERNPNVRVILLKANGRHFSAGADLNWMQRMVDMSEAENQADALYFAKVLYQLYQCTKPTVALVQGAVYGGGIGLVAACDLVIASTDAKFCFSEVTLGLIPAVISPYVIQAMGARATTALFLNAEVFDAAKAQALQLVHHIAPKEHLLQEGLNQAQALCVRPPQALAQAKALVRSVQNQPIAEPLLQKTADWIAKIRVSPEAQNALQLFLKRTSG